MAKFQKKDYGHWDVWRKSYTPSELDARYHQLARVTNTRIRRLKEGTSLYGDQDVNLWDRPYYAGIKTRLGGRKYFTEARHPKLPYYDLLNDITAMEDFLATTSSTVGGLRELERKRRDKFIGKGVPREIAEDPRFYSFLSSQTFAELDLYHVPSKKIVDLIREYSGDLTIDELVSLFNHHLNATPEREQTYMGLRKSLNKARRQNRKK